MENASKALIMAASILIAVMMVSFMVLILRRAGMMSAEYDSQRSEIELEKFNTQFEVYAKDGNTIFDVITVSNLAYDVNYTNGYDEKNNVKIYIKIGNNIKYAILPDDRLSRNYFFETDNSGNISQNVKGEAITVYMYSSSIIDTYNVADSNQNYKYLFNCPGSSTKYNEDTGKICEMTFTLEENSEYQN